MCACMHVDTDAPFLLLYQTVKVNMDTYIELRNLPVNKGKYDTSQSSANDGGGASGEAGPSVLGQLPSYFIIVFYIYCLFSSSCGATHGFICIDPATMSHSLSLRH